MARILAPILLFLASAIAGPAMAAELQLLMFEQPGCIYCARWNAEIAPEYPKTAEGQAAPLRRMQLRDPLPADITLVSPPVFTPTFVLIQGGAELARIEGYPGEDFFWPLLGQMLARAEPAPN